MTTLTLVYFLHCEHSMADKRLPQDKSPLDGAHTDVAVVTEPKRRRGRPSGPRRSLPSTGTRSCARFRGETANCTEGTSLDGSSIYNNAKYPHRGQHRQNGRSHDLNYFRDRRGASGKGSDDGSAEGSEDGAEEGSPRKKGRMCKRGHDGGHAIGRGDHDGEEEVVQLARHACGGFGSPERCRERTAARRSW